MRQIRCRVIGLEPQFCGYKNKGLERKKLICETINTLRRCISSQDFGEEKLHYLPLQLEGIKRKLGKRLELDAGRRDSKIIKFLFPLQIHEVDGRFISRGYGGGNAAHRRSQIDITQMEI